VRRRYPHRSYRTPPPRGVQYGSTRARQKPESSTNGRVDLGPILAALLPLIGGIVFVSLRGSYVRVYDRFGISPEDVGVNPYVVLTGAYRVFLLGNWRPISDTWSVILRWVIYGLPLALMFVVWRIGQSKSLPILGDRLKRTPPLRVVWLYLIIAVLAMAIVFQATIGIDVHRAISRIRDEGKPVRPGDFSYLGVQAYPAIVQPTEGHKLPAALLKNHKLLYLGHAANEIILYNPCTYRTWRISEGTALVILGNDRGIIPCGRVPPS
jgi:hypothetical protein